MSAAVTVALVVGACVAALVYTRIVLHGARRDAARREAAAREAAAVHVVFTLRKNPRNR